LALGPVYPRGRELEPIITGDDMNQILSNLSELIQDDLITILDGQPNELVNAVCQAVVDRINEAKSQTEQSE